MKICMGTEDAGGGNWREVVGEVTERVKETPG